MMSTILVSILNFCLETLPDCEWIDHMRLCKEREEDASPWFEIEAVCIVIFTGEFLLRILASPEGERHKGGLLAFCKNGANIIDFVRRAAPTLAAPLASRWPPRLGQRAGLHQTAHSLMCGALSRRRCGA
tara:strand:+ start:473 stop:862 length:390 start_codon:yes stop_codon:yes gene_type:complete